MLTKAQFTKKFAENLVKVRKLKEMSQEQLAAEAELYRTYVGHLENSRYSPSAYVIYKIIRALKIDPNDLLPK